MNNVLFINKKTFKKLFYIIVFLGVQVAYAQSVFISNKDFPNEPAIAVNHKNPNQILLGVAIGQAYFSNNGGATFKALATDTTYGLWSDPSVFFDNQNNAYYVHLSAITKSNLYGRIVCQLKKKNDTSFTVLSTIGEFRTACAERPMAYYNPHKNEIYLTYIVFDAYGSTNPKDSTRLYFTRSVDGGKTWENAIRLNTISGDCSDIDGSIQGATTAFDKQGNLAVVWGVDEKILINTYHAKTKKWLASEKLIAKQPNGWDFTIPALKMPNGLPVVVNCKVKSANKLVAFWIEFNTIKNQSLVYYSFSDNWGKDWSNPSALLTDTQSIYQFHVWASTQNNQLAVSCYEQQSNGKTYMRLFQYNAAQNKFNTFIVKDSDFYPDPEQYVGDMNQVAVFNKHIFLPYIKAEKGINSLYFIKFTLP